MNRPNHWIFGLALVLALTLAPGLPGASQAQQNDPGASYGPAGQDYNSGSYGANCRSYTSCPMGPGYEYSAPANQDSRHYVSRPRKVHRAARGSWNSSYARGYRGGWGYW